jgi:predicted nucleotidyltransferase
LKVDTEPGQRPYAARIQGDLSRSRRQNEGLPWHPNVTERPSTLPDFLVMKAHALAGRDKPKDAYDLCYCLEHFPDGISKLEAIWKNRRREKDVARAIDILKEKFASVVSFGP